jgi:hypothetical protein
LYRAPCEPLSDLVFLNKERREKERQELRDLVGKNLLARAMSAM